jgi:hypothetical protein
VRLWRPKTEAERADLQDPALLLGLLFPGEQGSPRGVLKYFPHALIRLRRAFEVLLGANLLANILGLDKR